MLKWIHETGWSLGFNDSTLLAWITTAGYLLAAALSLRAMRIGKQKGTSFARFWLILATVLLLLGLNKQLDLQTLLQRTGSRIALESGWYEQRNLVRYGFVAVVAMGFLASGIWLFAKKRISLPRNPLLWMSIALILVFVFIRTSALDGVFRAIGLRLDPDGPAHLLEFVGVVCLNGALIRKSRLDRT
jgi:hypothetical protein